MAAKTKKAARSLVLIGGREDKEGPCDILAEVAARAAGGRLVVVTLASEEPDLQWKTYLALFQRFGVKKPLHLQFTSREQAMSDGSLAAMLDGASVVFFTGGDQVRLVSRIAGTALHSRILAAAEAGATIAGTSAGAAAISETMLVGPRESDLRTVGSVFQTAAGLGLISDVIVDQHFTARCRIERLLGAVAEKPSALGIGIDENTAAFIEGDTLRVAGSGAVHAVDGREVTWSNVAEAEYDRTMAIFDLRLHILKAGNTLDLRTRRPSAGKND